MATSRTVLIAVLAAALGCGGEDDGPELTVDTVCGEMARRYCEQERPCCEKAGFGFNRDRCEAGYLDSCGIGVGAVRAGKARLDAAKVEACRAQYQPFVDICVLDPAQRLRAANEAPACREAFRGLVPLGGLCTNSVECVPDRDGQTFCGPDGVCLQPPPILGRGERCEDAGFAWCAADLTCDFVATGTCIPDPERRPIVSANGCVGR